MKNLLIVGAGQYGMVAIKADDPGPVLFKQKRVAQNKGYFELMKFRSMSVNTPTMSPSEKAALWS